MEEKKKKIKNAIFAAVALLGAGAMAVLPMLLRSSKEESVDTASYLTAQVTRGDIRTTISGGGTLDEETGVSVSVYKGVEVTRYLAVSGELVEAGQPLAEVDRTTVMQTIATVQDNLDHLEKDLQKAAGTAAVLTVDATTYGRIKAVYAREGDAVTEVMAEHGCLAVVSLDGLMAVRLQTEDESVRPGDAVTVTLADGTEKPGRVERRRGGDLTVTLTDDGPRLGEEASVRAADGTELGAGTLEVHSAWNVTAASGIVASVIGREEAVVYAGSRLFNLQDVDNTGEFRHLSARHREYETAMLELLELYRTGTVTAPISGRLSGLDTAKVGVMRAGEEGYALVLLAEEEGPSLPADPNDPAVSGMKNKSAMVSDVAFGSITFLVQDTANAAADFTEQPSLDFGNAHEETLYGFSGVTIYDYDREADLWKPINPQDLREGDLLYFVYAADGETDTLLWILRAPEPEEEPTPIWGGGFVPEPEFTPYDLTKTELLRIVPQNTVSVKVSIDELDILSVAVGQDAEITVDALPGRAFSGTVTRIDPNGKNSGGNSKYTITITMDRDPNMLKGMNATAILTVGVTGDVLTLPVAALSQKGGRTVAYTAFDEKTRTLLAPVEVTTGVSDGTTVQILGGLEEGMSVWYSYYESEAVPGLFVPGPADNT